MLGVNKYQNQTMLPTKYQLSANETIFYINLSNVGDFIQLLIQ